MSENIGEELSYWYVRVNGFFTIENFVLQKTAEAELEDGQITLHNADADLLAVRPACVSESIGNQPIIWDRFWRQLPEMELDEEGLTNQENFERDQTTTWSGPVALIVQAKMGATINNLRAFMPDRLRLCLNRLGILEPASPEFVQALEKLSTRPYAIVGDEDQEAWLVRKILVTAVAPPAALRVGSFSHLQITPSHIVERLRTRFQDYADKAGAWEFFPGIIMQLLALEQEGRIDL